MNHIDQNQPARYRKEESGSAEGRDCYFGPPMPSWPELLVCSQVKRIDLQTSKLTIWHFWYESNEPFAFTPELLAQMKTPVAAVRLSREEMEAITKGLGLEAVIFMQVPGLMENARRYCAAIKAMAAESEELQASGRGLKGDSEKGPVYRAGMDVLELASAVVTLGEETGVDADVTAELSARIAGMEEILERTFRVTEGRR